MSTTSTTALPADQARTSISRSRTRRARALVVLAATGAGLLGWAVAGPIAGIHLAVRLGPTAPVQHIGPGAVVIAALLTGLASWALVAVLERFTAKARTIWTTGALITLVLSLTGPLAGLTTAATIALIGLHLLVATVLIAGLRRRWAPRS